MAAKDWNWPKDPTVKRERGGGPPPDGHIRRCQGRNAFLSEREGKDIQCGRWALVGRSYCSRCGGRQPRYKARVAARRWYSKHAGETLAKKLSEMADAPPDERISLESEIDMARVLAVESVAIFDAVCIQDKTGTATAEQAHVLKAQATQAARDSMTFVASIIDKAARVRALSSGTIDAELVGYLVHQVQAVIERHVVPLDGGQALCDKITADLNDIKLPNEQHGHRNPDDLAKELRDVMGKMDTTVMGAVPEESSDE